MDADEETTLDKEIEMEDIAIESIEELAFQLKDEEIDEENIEKTNEMLPINKTARIVYINDNFVCIH